MGRGKVCASACSVCLLCVFCAPIFVGSLACAHVCSQFADHAGELHYYIPNLVVEAVPAHLSSAEFVSKCEAGSAPSPTHPITTEADAFLSSEDQLLLLLGDPGSGKSMFAWLNGQHQLEQARQGAAGGGASPDGNAGCGSSGGDGDDSGGGVGGWVPVVLDLKRYKPSQLCGLLPRVLVQELGLPQDLVPALGPPTALPRSVGPTATCVP